MFAPCVLALVGAVIPAADKPAKPTFTFHSGRDPGWTDHVIVRLEVGGDAKYTDNGKPQQEKMSVDCQLDYLEKTLEVARRRQRRPPFGS